jgi:transposase
MKNRYEQSKFIKILEEAPFISYAAKKSGISRATIYRWKKNNPEFREQLEKALNSGREHLVDIAEMALVEKIKGKDMTAIKFFLQHNDKRYRPVRTAFIPPPPPEPETKLKDWSICENCGSDRISRLSDEDLNSEIKELENKLKDENNTS